MSEEKKDIFEIIGEYFQKYPEMSGRKIAERIIEDGNNCGLGDRAIRYRISDYKDAAGTINVEESEYQEELQKKFRNPLTILNEDSDDPIASIKTKFGTVSMPMSKIDKMHYQYSEMGENQTELDLITNFRLKVWQWNAIKNAFRLRKKSNIYSDYTIHNLPTKDVEPIIESKMDELLGSKRVAKKMYDKAILRKYKKLLKQHDFAVVENLAFMNEIASNIEVFKKPVTIAKYPKQPDIFEAQSNLIVLADFHFGAEYEGGERTPKVNTEMIKQKLRKVLNIANHNTAKTNDVLILGDLIESFTGLNHPNSWQGIERGMYGAKVVMEVYDVLVWFMEELKNFGTLYMVPGNHDRSTPSNKEDVRGEIAYIVSGFLEKAFPGRIINLGDIGSFCHGPLNFIATHGHLGLSRESGAAMAYKYGKQGYFNMVLMGHLHSRIIKNNDDGLDFRKIICPSIFSGNQYSEQGGWDGGSGFLMIRQDAQGKPIVTDYCL
jgi:metallophosphoesterase superfamily enzyme